MKYFKPIIFLLLLTGCFPEDKIVIPLDIDFVEIPYYIYDNQVWFRLKDTTIVSHNSIMDWDIGFESNGPGHHVILNTSRFMYAGNTGSTVFDTVSTNTTETMIFDDSDGDLDSTAIGQWADFTDPENPVYHKNVYIIDLNYESTGLNHRYKKIVFEKFENNTYSIHYSNLDGSDEHFTEIPTDSVRQFTLFSFKDGGSVAPIQPPDVEWDICFTQYSTILLDDPTGNYYDYLVRGVLLNTAGTMAVAEKNNSFYDITINDMDNYTLSSSRDVIGYNWKDYNSKEDEYIIIPDLFYIIKDQWGNYYKLMFTGFYNKSGDKGYPSFQFVNLSYIEEEMQSE